MDPLNLLCKKLGYEFKKKDLLKSALTHRSVRTINNERLEFLGDSILNFVIAEALYRRAPRAKEGELSRLRSFLVRGEMLASLAKEFEIGEYLRLGMGELKSGGFRRKSILADAIEAIIAAIYLDSGIEACRERILVWFETRIAKAMESKIEKDPKTQLQEYLQARKMALPIYTVTAIKGEAHDQFFHVLCEVKAFSETAEGSGSNRRAAEQAAAQKLLDRLHERIKK